MAAVEAAVGGEGAALVVVVAAAALVDNPWGYQALSVAATQPSALHQRSKALGSGPGPDPMVLSASAAAEDFRT